MTDARFGRVVDILERTLAFLQERREEYWVARVTDLLRALRTADEAGRDPMYRRLRSECLGGMGSLQDLAIFDDIDGRRTYNREADARLNRLTDELHEALAPDY